MKVDIKFFLIIILIAVCSAAIWFFYGGGKTYFCPSFERLYSDTTKYYDSIPVIIEGSEVGVTVATAAEPLFPSIIDTQAVIEAWHTKKNVSANFQNADFRIDWDFDLYAGEITPVKLKYTDFTPTLSVSNTLAPAYKWQVYGGGSAGWGRSDFLYADLMLIHNGKTQFQLSYNVLDPNFNLKAGISFRLAKWGNPVNK